MKNLALAICLWMLICLCTSGARAQDTKPGVAADPATSPTASASEPSIAEREGLDVEYRTAIFIFINIREKAEEHFTAADVQQLRANLFTVEKSVDAVYSRCSFGQTRFTPEHVLIPAPITVEPTEEEGCPRAEYRTKATAALREQGIEPTDYLHRFFILPSGRQTDSGCRFSPSAYVGTIGSKRSRSATSTVYGVFTLVHEMGHNLGFNHAHTDKNNNGYDLKEETDRKYGDASCIMGASGALKGFNAPHADQAGWFEKLPEGTRITLSEATEAEFTILPYGRDPYRQPGTQIVRIPRRGKEQEFYYLSFRKAEGIDAKVQERYTQGVNLHWARMPGKGTQFIQALQDGEEFIDEESQLRVTQLAHDADGVRIKLTFTPQ